MAIKFGLLLTPGAIKGARKSWLADLDTFLLRFTGLADALWISDHLFWEDQPTLEAWTSMAYVAARYPQFEVGSSVLCQNYRNPALLAKMAATLQDLSGNRLILGLGAGWKEDEYSAYNYQFPEPKDRLGQLEDSLEILKRLWTEPGKVTYHGRYYQVTDAYFEPRPPMPRIMIGGRGDRSLRIAARYADLWNQTDSTLETYLERMGAVRRACQAIGRDPATLRMTYLSRLVPGRTEAEAHDRGNRLGKFHFKGWTFDQAFIGTPTQIIDQVSAFARAGVEYFIFEIVGLPDPDVIGMVVEDILPHI